MTSQPFDSVAQSYEEIHNQNLPPGIESGQMFEQKAEWISRLIQKHYSLAHPARVLDFGCSTGRLSRRILEQPSVSEMVGVDESTESVRLAQSLSEPGSTTSGTPSIARKRPIYVDSLDRIASDIQFDVIFACNVLHHIAPDKRRAEVAALCKRLSPGGKLIIWEHNPWNPLTRLLVKICPFDEGVELLKMNETIALFESFSLQTTLHEFVNFTPPGLQNNRAVQWIEQKLSGVPMGAQYRLVFEIPRRQVAR